MAATATPAKTAAPAPVPAAAPEPLAASKVRQGLRAAQVKRISRSRLKPIGHFSDPQEAMLPPDWDFTDALDPAFWALIARELQANVHASILHDRLGTTIDISTEDHAFYGQVKVVGLKRNKEGHADAVVVTCIGPIYDPVTNKCYPVDLKTGGIWKGRPAPVNVETETKAA